MFSTFDSIKKLQEDFTKHVESTFDEIRKKHFTFDELILDDLHPRVSIIEKQQPVDRKEISKNQKNIASLHALTAEHSQNLTKLFTTCVQDKA